MSLKYGLLATEGAHDQAAVGKILKLCGFKDFKEEFGGEHKAVVASIVSILKPGMANTPSIAQDNWISEQTVKDVAEIAMLKQFLENLLELPSVASAIDSQSGL